MGPRQPRDEHRRRVRIAPRRDDTPLGPVRRGGARDRFLLPPARRGLAAHRRDVDRIGQGHVVDFVDVGIPGGPRFWAFNVADSSIVVGIIAVTALLWWQDRQQQRALRHA
jgi:Signal peptidase (SPase) II